ncbi:GNAT family N-acetyltransferase [Aliikangiella maris]|uniref:GNAT family N-acetyltransferase n=2 Tax=Aliikangiella maris TaxID=3162458 RepID=A0ABV2BP35_9GAMM
MSHQIQQAFYDWLKNLEYQNIRGLLLITEKTWQQLKIDWQNIYPESTISLSYNTEKSNQNNRKSLSADLSAASLFEQQLLLGNEYQIYIHNASSQFDVNLFAALCGGIKGGGCLFLILPNQLNNWLHQYVNLINNHLKTKQLIHFLQPIEVSPVLKRILKFNLTNPAVSIICPVTLKFYSGLVLLDSENNTSKNNSAANANICQNKNNSKNYQEQEKAIEKIIRVATGHSKRPLVLTASRGRGKSAALGIASNVLCNKASFKIIVTAPNVQNLNSYFKHLDKTLFQQSTKDKKYNCNNGSSVQFIPIDRIIQNQPEANLLLIDEAAAFPVNQLTQIIAHYNRIIFSSTTDGYEGNGKGFELRFQKILLKKFPQARFTSIARPIRWSVNDKLENACFNALLLNSTNGTQQVKLNNLSELKFDIIDKAELTSNESYLSQVFSLLINAHYQTRPADLESILTNPKLTVAVLFKQKEVVAVALLNQEGNLTSETINQLNHSSVRLKGELIPQSIICNLGYSKAGTYRYLRIMRIATLPYLQSFGIGSLLLKNIQDYAHLQQIDFLGASFACDSKILNFWLKNHYSIYRIGSRKDSSTGLFTCDVLMTINAKLKSFLPKLLTDFEASLIYNLNHQFITLENKIVYEIIRQQFEYNSLYLNSHTRNELKAFSNHQRSFTQINWLLKELLLTCLSNKDQNTLESTPQVDWLFLIDCLLFYKTEETLSRIYQLTGKKQKLKRLKDLTTQLLNFSLSSEL